MDVFGVNQSIENSSLGWVSLEPYVLPPRAHMSIRTGSHDLAKGSCSIISMGDFDETLQSLL